METTVSTLVGGVVRSIEVVGMKAVLGSSQGSWDEGRGKEQKMKEQKLKEQKFKEQKIVVIDDQKSRSYGQE
ncbi:MAG: hypothetical protein GY749_13595 [Desulfobacteraceae bacterium]|nr:hypothetical protein [Desulfobacteraceae bacterium]